MPLLSDRRLCADARKLSEQPQCYFPPYIQTLSVLFVCVLGHCTDDARRKMFIREKLGETRAMVFEYETSMNVLRGYATHAHNYTENTLNIKYVQSVFGMHMHKSVCRIK